jgi:hypothetical protein
MARPPEPLLQFFFLAAKDHISQHGTIAPPRSTANLNTHKKPLDKGMNTKVYSVGTRKA